MPRAPAQRTAGAAPAAAERGWRYPRRGGSWTGGPSGQHLTCPAMRQEHARADCALGVVSAHIPRGSVHIRVVSAHIRMAAARFAHDRVAPSALLALTL